VRIKCLAVIIVGLLGVASFAYAQINSGNDSTNANNSTANTTQGSNGSASQSGDAIVKLEKSPIANCPPCPQCMVPKNKRPKAPSPWKGTNIGIGWVKNTGNTVSNNFTGTSNFQYRYRKWTYLGQLNYQRNSSNNVVSAEKWFAQTEIKYNLHDFNYLFWQTNYTDDRFDGYFYIFNSTAGYGRRIVNLDNFNLNLYLGPGYQRLKIRGSNETDSLPVLTAGGNFVWQINKRVQLNETAQTFMTSENIHSEATTALVVSLFEHWDINLSWALDHDSKPQDGAHGTSTTTSLQVVYNIT